MKEEKRVYASIVIASTVKDISVVRRNYSTWDCEEDEEKEQETHEEKENEILEEKEEETFE